MQTCNLTLRLKYGTALLLVSVLFSVLSTAQQSAEDTAFFQFIESDGKTVASKTPVLKSVSAVESMMATWQAYEKETTSKLKKQISEARTLGAELLAKKALTSSAEMRGALLKESQRLTSMDVDEPLATETSDPKDVQRLKDLLGSWTTGKWSPNFEAYGQFKPNQRNQRTTWSWLDVTAGVVILHAGNIGNVLWFDKPDVIKGLNTANGRDTLKKKGAGPVLATDPAVAKMHADELKLREATDSKLNNQRQRIITWLLEQAQGLPSTGMVDLLTKINHLETDADKHAGGISKFVGDWRWETMEVTFQPLGKVTLRGGQAIGKWDWIDAGHTWLAVVLKGGKSAGDVFIATAPSDPRQDSMEVQRVVGPPFKVTRIAR